MSSRKVKSQQPKVSTVRLNVTAEIFTELSRMGYEKPSTKLTFYKAFFSPQWKFLIHTIMQCMSAKRTSWNEFNSSMASAVICLSTCRKFNFPKEQVGDLSMHSTKYSSPALTQKVFSNMRRVGKGFSGVDRPLFEGIVDVNTDDVLTAVDEPSKPSPPPTTPPPPPSQDVPSTSQVQPPPPPSLIAQPPSPQQQPQPLQDAEMSMNLLHTLLETCTTLTRRVEHLEQDKIAQALEITKLKQRIKKLERRNKLKVSKLRRLKKVGTAQRVDTSDDTDVTDIAKEVVVDAEIEENDEIEPVELQEVVEVLTTAKLMTEVVTAASAIITAAAPTLTTAAAPTLTTAPSVARRRKGVVIRDPEETATPSTIIHSESKSKDKGKLILAEEPKPLKKQAQIKQDETYARELEVELNKNINWDDVIDQVQRKEKEDNAVMRNYFKGMKYDDIRPIFEKYFNSNMAFLEKTREQMEEEDSKALKRANEMPNDEDDVYTEATPLARKVPVVDYEIYTENNKPDYKIIRADGSPHLFLSFFSLLRNSDREDLKVLWELVKERFASSKPKNFSDDFLLTTLTYMFEKPDVQAQVWKNQRRVHGLAKRRYPLSRFTLDQMLNNVRLKVEEESEVSLELPRFVRQQQQEGFIPE
nr:hypothetical protein [Tanacetum cinerariifolium]